MHHGLSTVLSLTAPSVLVCLAVAAPSLALAAPASPALVQQGGEGEWPPLFAKLTVHESPVANSLEPGYDNGNVAIWLNSDNDDQDNLWDLARPNQPDDPIVAGGDNELSRLVAARQGGPPGPIGLRTQSHSGRVDLSENLG